MKHFMPILVAAAAGLMLTASPLADQKHRQRPVPQAGGGGGSQAENDAPAPHPKTMHEGMIAPGLVMPSMDAANGRKLFASKGCVVCHAINGVGGEDAAPLDFATMSAPMMSPFNFAARMWRGAEAMIVLQREELGGQIELTGDELSDIIAFVHDIDEQKTFSEADIPPHIAKLIAHEDMPGEQHGGTAEPDSGKAGEAPEPQ